MTNIIMLNNLYIVQDQNILHTLNVLRFCFEINVPTLTISITIARSRTCKFFTRYLFIYLFIYLFVCLKNKKRKDRHEHLRVSWMLSHW